MSNRIRFYKKYKFNYILKNLIIEFFLLIFKKYSKENESLLKYLFIYFQS
jgi:hypothetical protein